MKMLLALIKRNCKLFFKDKGMFFSSLITPLILLILYSTFLSDVFKSSFQSFMPEGTPEKLINATVGGQLLSSLLAVCCVTVAFCSNLLMVQDKVNETKKDLTITPVKHSILAFGYYLSTFFVTLIICLIALIFCLVYLFIIGWYMHFVDILLLILDVILLVLFGTALSSIINFFLTSQGQMSAVGTIVSCAYGFICGAYMPISQFNPTLQKILSFLPGTYGTSLIRNHAMQGVLNEMKEMHWPSEVLEQIKDSMDCNLYFFQQKVEIWVMYLILIVTIIILIVIYILFNCFCHKKK